MKRSLPPAPLKGEASPPDPIPEEGEKEVPGKRRRYVKKNTQPV